MAESTSTRWPRWCKFCGSKLVERALYCVNCGRPIGRWRRLVAGLRTTAEILAFVATSGAILFLSISTYYTREQLSIQRDAFTEQKRTSDLQDSLIRQQLNLLISQNEQARAANVLQLRAIEIDSQQLASETKRIIEERRPRLSVDKIDCKWDSASSLYRIFLNVTNHGLATASSSSVKVSVVWSGSTESFHEIDSIGDILKSAMKVTPHALPGSSQRVASLIRTELAYSWLEYGLPYREEKYYYLEEANVSHMRSCRTLTLENAREMMRGMGLQP